MPIDLAGISNVNEFYSEHYLQTVFEGDVQELRSQWREMEKSGETPPDRLLEKAGSVWRRLVTKYKEERNDRDRLLIFREFADAFLSALGYEREFRLVPDAEEKLLPVTARRVDALGHDRVWVLETVAPREADFETGPLQLRFCCEQFEKIDAAANIEKRRKDAAETALNKGVFALRHPPRFVILLSMAHAVLIDREKWSDSRLLSFDFSEIFVRNDFTTIGAVTALLHATSLAPDSGTALIDRIDEESHRHAYGVSQDLKFSLRKAIELLGNEAATQIVTKRREQGKGVFTGEHALDAGILSTECLRYMYRLLFLLYIEARPQLGFAPMNAEAYAKGYSLESLRNLALIPLETDEDRNGHYISDTIDTLFRIVFEGTPASGSPEQAAQEIFTFAPVRARLFDPAAIGAHLGGLRLRNSVMQEIVELLSLSQKSRGRFRGRISYVNLGISQLGAVYESLLSFSGFFADEDLIELKSAEEKNPPGPLEAAFFAPQRRASEFETAEIVYDDKSPRIYPKGTFIYRLSGRNRENSASYYTPEPLARTLVKYALKELLEGKKADDILKLKVIEPAMGSAAFLVEVVNQLTDRYLELKQAELDKRIPHEERADVERRVRTYIADRNVFGVDLNPIAVELGQISLWLNCLHKGGHAPWFDDQVHNGNSLIGARRAVFPADSLSAKSEDDRWHKRKPREIGWSGEKRKANEVWHFLLPDPGMSTYDQNIVRPLAPDAWREFGEWRRDFVRPLDAVEIENLLRMSKVVDQLFEDVADRLTDMRRSVNDDIAIWPARPSDTEKHADFSEKIKRLAAFHGEGLHNAGAWKRLKTTMDAWCALWVWPIEKATLLPSRASFIADVALVLEGRMGGNVPSTADYSTRPAQGILFEPVLVPGGKNSGALFATEERAAVLARKDLFGDVDIEKLVGASTWLPTAMGVAKNQHFMHYELEFADIMRDRRGFDLVIGNPPWLKPAWIDGDVLSEIEPKFGVRSTSAADVEKGKLALLRSSPRHREWYLRAYAETGGLRAFLSSYTCYPFLSGGQPNLYKCFIDLAFRITSKSGIAALIHQDGHLSEASAKSFRQSWYRRIIKHFQFRNELTSELFAEVDHGAYFSLNIYRGFESDVSFDHIATLFSPRTINESYEHDGVGPVPSLRSINGGWNTKGHKDRIVKINSGSLECIAKVIESRDAPAETTRFLFPYSVNTLSYYEKLGGGAKSFVEAVSPFQMRPLWHETGSTKRDGILENTPSFPESIQDVILTGPSFYVGNPLYKTPSADGQKSVVVDHQVIGDNYIPRTNYMIVADAETYNRGLPSVSWDENRKHTDFYRIAFRRRLPLKNERKLIAALIAPGVAHVHSVESLAFSNEDDLIAAYPLWLSLPYDFILRAGTASDLSESTLRNFPWADIAVSAKARALRLACLTAEYAPLWNRMSSVLQGAMPWSSSDPRLVSKDFRSEDHNIWNRECGLRSPFARRYALVEIDVLVAQALGLTLDDWLEMYRASFNVFDTNEKGTWYDSAGQVVWTWSTGIQSLGWKDKDGQKPNEATWRRDFADMPIGSTLECDVDVEFMPNGPRKMRRTFIAPFATCDRESDYRRAWAFFEAQAKQKAA